MPRTVIQTDRLLLQELEDRDAPFVVELLNTEGFLRHIGDRGVRDAEGAIRYLLEGPRASYARNGHGLWKVVLKAGGCAVGMSGLVRREVLPGPDLGYAFLPAWTGRGLAREAGAAVLDFGFGTLGLAEVLAIVKPDNLASIRLLGDLGFARREARDVEGAWLEIHAVAPPAAA